MHDKDVELRMVEQEEINNGFMEKVSDDYYSAEASTGKKKQKKEKIVSLMKKMMITSLGPLLIMGIVITVFAVYLLKTNLRQEKLNSLMDYAISSRAAIEASNPGDYSIQDGKLYKGDICWSDDKSLLDNYASDTGAELILYYGDEAKLSSLMDSKNNTRILGKCEDSAIVEQVVGSSKTFSTDKALLNGDKFYAAYIPIRNSGNKAVGMLCALQPTSEVNRLVNIAAAELGSTSIIIIIISALIAGYSSFSIARATKIIGKSLSELADGYLEITVNMTALRRSDELGVMARALQKTAKQMTGVVRSINSTTRKLVKAGDMLSESSSKTSDINAVITSSVESISNGAVQQAEDVIRANEAVEEMDKSIISILESINALNRLASTMIDADDKSETIIGELAESNTRTVEAIKEVSERVNATDKSVAKIQEAVSIITTIADETSLLSLNANIEAARAGEAGRGFSVVATQIQKLAEESSRSAARIEETIAELSAESHATVSVMEEMDLIAKEQQDKLDATRDCFKDVSRGINNTINETKIIEGQSDKCGEANHSVQKVIDSLSNVSSKNADDSMRTSSIMNELSNAIEVVEKSSGNLQKIASDMQENVKFFKL